MSAHDIRFTVNGESVEGRADARVTLVDFLRDELNLTGAHAACEHGVCGACTVIVDGSAVRSCLMLAVQANGATVATVEGLASPTGDLHPIQEAMRQEHGLQCGFCTPGVVMTLAALTQRQGGATEEEMLAALSGHLCRCTGYQGMRRAVRRLAGAQGGKAGA